MKPMEDMAAIFNVVSYISLLPEDEQNIEKYT